MATVFLLWPALWVSFSDVINNLYRGIAVIGVETDHYQYYFGKLVNDPGPFYYIVVLVFRSSLYLVGGLLGLILVRKHFMKKKELKFVSFFLIFSFFYILQHTLPAKKLDRYILPALIGLLPIKTSKKKFTYLRIVPSWDKRSLRLYFLKNRFSY